MLRTIIVPLASSLALATTLHGQPLPLPLPPLPLPLPMEGTPEDRAACEPDVRMYCQAAIPDTMRVLACLQQNRQRIGPACLGVLQKYGQ